MNAKKFVMYLATVLYIFLAANLLFWHGHTKKIFDNRDLNRLGVIATSEAATKEAQYTKHHTKYYEGVNKSFDVITIGDSFSNAGGGSYYQDYLEEKYSLKVLNIRENFFALINSKIIDEVKPRAVIYEIVERSVQNALGEKEILEFPPIEQNKQSRNASQVFLKISSGLFPSVMGTINFQFLYSKIYQMFTNEQVSSEVNIEKLDRELFTNSKQEKMFLYLRGDLWYLRRNINAYMINKNLNNAAEILREKNVQLIFMPCADKYDLYYPYIVDKKGRPENNLFPELEKVSPKYYTFIDTRKILREALARGEKDIYWLNDTHWSWKGAELVCDEIVKYLRQK